VMIHVSYRVMSTLYVIRSLLTDSPDTSMADTRLSRALGSFPPSQHIKS